MNPHLVRSHYWGQQRWSVGAIGSLGWAYDGEVLRIRFVGKSAQIISSARKRRELGATDAV